MEADEVWSRKGPDLTPKAQEVYDWFKSLDPQSRWTMFQVLHGKWCQYCGGPAPCQCWNDE